MVQKVSLACYNCVYSNHRGSHDRKECRRYPPTVSSLSTNCSDFPMVKINDWCGEFKEKE